MADNNISKIMDVTMEKIRALVDSDTIIGEPVTVGEVTIIPVSRFSFGFASGGSDLASKPEGGNVYGGGGAGATVTPVSFLVIRGTDVKLLNLNDTQSPIEKVVSAVPEIIDTVSSIFKKDEPEKPAK